MTFHWWRRSNPWLWWMYKLFNQRDTQETETPKVLGFSLNAHSHILFPLSHVARPLNLSLLFSIHHPRPKQRLPFSLFIFFLLCLLLSLLPPQKIKETPRWAAKTFFLKRRKGLQFTWKMVWSPGSSLCLVQSRTFLPLLPVYSVNFTRGSKLDGV